MDRYTKTSIFLWCLVVLLALVVYWPSFNAPFQFDDTYTIARNYTIRNWKNIVGIWRFDPARVLTHYSFAMNFHFGGLKTTGYHIVNFLLHICVALAVYRFLSIVMQQGQRQDQQPWASRWIPFCATVIFLVHPIQTAAVTYVSQRSTLLASLCYLIAVVYYLQFRLYGRRLYYAVSIASAGIGIFTKQIMFTLPLTLIICEIFFVRSSRTDIKKIFRILVPYVVLSCCVVVLIMLWQSKSLGLNELLRVTRETQTISRKAYLFTQCNVLMTYLRLLFVPINQNLDYWYPITTSFFMFPTPLSCTGLVLLLVLACRWFRARPLYSFGIAWFFATIILESSIFPISDVIFEHRVYLPMIGFTLLTVCFLVRCISSPRIYGIVIVGIVAILSILTYQRNALWSDPMAFLEDVKNKSPEKPRAYNNLGVFYIDQKEYEKAAHVLERAVALKDDFADAYNNLGIAYYHLNDTTGAIGAYERALEVTPDFAGPYLNLGHIYRHTDSEKAEQMYRKALEGNPYFPYAHVGLGNLFADKKDYVRAKIHYHAALEIDSAFASAHHGLGNVYLKNKRYAMALRAFLKAQRIEQGDPELFNKIANLYTIRNEHNKALEYYKKALAVDPSFADAHFNSALVFEKEGRFVEAEYALQAALNLYRQQQNVRMVAQVKKRLSVLRAKK